MSGATLPMSLRHKLTLAIRRLRFLHIIRNLSTSIIVLAIFAAVALAADYAFDLPGEARIVMFAIWLSLGTWLLLRGLIMPMRRQAAPEAVAAAIEDRFPWLAERLTTSIELERVVDEFHGSPQLVGRLINEAEIQSQQLDFQEAFPARRSIAMCSMASVVLLLILSPALLWTDRYFELGRRFLFPWQDVSAVPYALKVTPGDAFAARGRPLSVSARFDKKREGVVLPQSCTLVRVDANGLTSEDRMMLDGDGFSFTIAQLTDSFTYRIEAGKAKSATHQITAINPVEIATTKAAFMWQEDSPAITITAPVYARATIPTERAHEIADLTALQHSRATFSLRFNRPAVAALLEINEQEQAAKPQANDQEHGESKIIPLELSPDRQEGRVEIPAASDATYRFVLEAEHDIRTELAARKLSVKIDQPPKFTQVLGAADAKEINPYDQLSLDVAVSDDVGVDALAVEYRVNKGPTALEPIVLDGQGKQKAAAKHRFSLVGKVKDGDDLAYRLKVTDNRRVPEAGLEPNIAYYPPELEPGKPRWRTLKVAQQAQPLAQQEILARQDDINRRLEAIKDELLKEQRGVYKLRMESRYQSNLVPEQVEDLRQVRQEARGTDRALRDLARTAAESPDFQPLARRTQDVSEREMQSAIQKLGEAEQQLQRPERDRNLRDADRELSTALRRLDDIRREAERLAQARMDQIKLENLANRQEQLAHETAGQILRDPVKEPANADTAGKLKQNQNELANELQRQIAESPDLRQAVESIRAEQIKQLAERALDLARNQNKLNKAARESDQQQNRDKLADLARRQKNLADQTSKLAKESQPSTEATKSKPLKAESAQQAAEALQQGNATQAVQKQTQMAHELDRLAGDLDKAREQARQREAARQLAAKQEALRQRVTDEAQKKDPKLSDRLKDMEQEQKAIQQAAEKLTVPADNPQAPIDRALAAERAAKAGEVLQKGDSEKADSRMAQARQALERLAGDRKVPEMKFESQTKEARRLAQEQRQLRAEVQKALNTRPPLNAQQTEQLARQEALRRQAGDLAGELLPLAQQLPQVPKIMEAFSSEQSARGAMQQAQTQSQAGNQTQAQQSRQEVAQSLNRAAQQIEQAVQQMSKAQAAAAQQKTGQALQQAQNQMKQAQDRLNQGQQRSAPSPMRQAAQALQQAAQQLAQQQQQQQQQQPGTPTPDSTSGTRGVAAGAEPDIRLLGKDMEKYAGKSWGQLPGELRNQILQDMKARYGEDYARIIKLYFEQIAETKEK